MNAKLKPKAGRWQLQDAKAKFSQVFERALTEGPQYVTRHGKQAVVIMPAAEYEQLTGKNKMPSIVEAFLAFPKGTGFKMPERDKNDFGRAPPDFG